MVYKFRINWLFFKLFFFPPKKVREEREEKGEIKQPLKLNTLEAYYFKTI